MTEKEKREDEILKTCIQEAYGLSDEQLLAELEELEATLLDDEFVGAEERIFAKIKEREKEEEAAEETVSAEVPVSKPAPIKKLSKKKKWIVFGIAAALVVGAGVSTIGESNTYLRERIKENGVVLNSGQNIVRTGGLQEAYEKIVEGLDIPVLKINHLPNKLIFEQLIMDENNAILVFSYENKKIYFVQKQKSVERSIGISSDRKLTEKKVHNSWLSTDIYIEENILEKEEVEYSATIYSEKASYRLIGKMSEKDFTEILMDLSY